MAAKDEVPPPKSAAPATLPATPARQPEGNKASADQKPQATEPGAPVVGPMSGPDAGEFARARTALGELLAAFGISRAVLVDDEAYDFDEADLFAQVEAHKSDAIKVLGPLGEGLNLAAPLEVWQDRLRARWMPLLPTDRRAVFARLTALDGTDAEVHGRFASVVRDLLPIDTTILTPDEWRVRQGELVAERIVERDAVRSCPTLVLFDLDLSKAGMGDLGGETLALALIEGNAGVQILCGIVSSKLGHEGALVGSTQHADRIVRIDKRNLPDAPWTFVYELKKALLAPRVMDLKAKARQLIGEAHEEAIEKLDGVDLFDFVYAVITLSDTEGVREWETHFRLYGSFFDEALRRRALGDPALSALGNSVRTLARLAPDAKQPRDLATWRLQRREVLDDVKDVNRFHLPLQTGDVFECASVEGTVVQYVLLSPACDLIIRPDGGRRLKTHGLLVRIGKEPATLGSPTSTNLPYFREDGATVSVKLPDHVSAALWVLDLCVFNSDGNAQHSIGAAPPEGLSAGWKLRYPAVTAEVRRIIEKEKATIGPAPAPPRPAPVPPGQPGSAQAHGARIDLPPRFLGYPFQKAYVTIAPDTLIVDCRRSERIRPAYAAELLTRLGQYISRAAFDTDLGVGNLPSS